MLDATAFEVFGAGQVEGGAAVDVLDIQVDGWKKLTWFSGLKLKAIFWVVT